VLQSDGRPSGGFHWLDSEEDRSVREVLAEEGVLLDDNDRAAANQRVPPTSLAERRAVSTT